MPTCPKHGPYEMHWSICFRCADEQKEREGRKFTYPRLLTGDEIEDLRADAKATSAEAKRLIAERNK